MIHLYIFTKDDGYSESIRDEVYKRLQESNPIEIEGRDISVFFYKDSITSAETTIKNLENTTTYIALHKTAIKESDKIDKWKRKFNFAMINNFSHTEGDFYHKVVPKVFSGTITIADIEKFFPSKLENELTLFDDIVAGKDVEQELNETEKSYYEEFKKQVKEGVSPFDHSEEAVSAFAKLRDEIYKRE